MMTAMDKSANSPPHNTIHSDEDWTSHPIVEWLIMHKNLFIWVFLGLIGLLILTSRLIAWRTLDAEKDFFEAQALFTQIEQAAATSNPSLLSANLERLQAIIERHPELKPQYEGALAQILLVNGDVSKAQLFVDDVFKRTEFDHLKLYQEYTEASLLIGQGLYTDALAKAKQLKQELDQLGGETHPVLYAFNLVRLGMLYQQVGQLEEEMTVWQHLQHSSQQTAGGDKAHHAYQIGHASLNQYIEERKNALGH